MMELNFLCQKDLLDKLKRKTTFASIFCYENKLTFPIHISDQKFENSMDLLLITDKNNSHYVHIKNFDRFMFHKTKNKNKKILLQELFIVF